MFGHDACTVHAVAQGHIDLDIISFRAFDKNKKTKSSIIMIRGVLIFGKVCKAIVLWLKRIKPAKPCSGFTGSHSAFSHTHVGVQ